jgi:hypothetical protein
MTRTVLKTLTAIAALAIAAASLSAPGFAADGNGIGRTKFKILVPKSDRGQGASQVVTSQFVAPKAKKDGGPSQVVTSQFVAPKAKKDGGNGGSGPVVFRLTPKAPPAGSGPTGSGGFTTAKIVTPKAPRGDGPAIASTETPAPLLLAPAAGDGKAEAKIEAPAESALPAPEPAPEAKPAIVAASDGQVALAYLRAAARYGYGDDTPGYDGADRSDRGYGDGYDGDDSYGGYGDGCD